MSEPRYNEHTKTSMPELVGIDIEIVEGTCGCKKMKTRQNIKTRKKNNREEN